MRVYELARDLGVESKDLLTRAQELGVDVKTASSGLGDDDAELLRLSYAEESPEQAAPVDADADGEADTDTAPAPADEAEPAADEPVPEKAPAEGADDDADVEDVEEEARRRPLTVVEGITVQVEQREITGGRWIDRERTH